MQQIVYADLSIPDAIKDQIQGETGAQIDTIGIGDRVSTFSCTFSYIFH